MGEQALSTCRAEGVAGKFGPRSADSLRSLARGQARPHPNVQPGEFGQILSSSFSHVTKNLIILKVVKTPKFNLIEVTLFWPWQP